MLALLANRRLVPGPTLESGEALVGEQPFEGEIETIYSSSRSPHLALPPHSQSGLFKADVIFDVLRPAISKQLDGGNGLESRDSSRVKQPLLCIHPLRFPRSVSSVLSFIWTV